MIADQVARPTGAREDCTINSLDQGLGKRRPIDTQGISDRPPKLQQTVGRSPDPQNDTAGLLPGRAGGKEVATSESASPISKSKSECNAATAVMHDADARDRGNLDGISVYNGRHLVGSSYDIGCRYAAELADGTDLGVFPNRRAATDAILAARRRDQTAPDAPRAIPGTATRHNAPASETGVRS